MAIAMKSTRPGHTSPFPFTFKSLSSSLSLSLWDEMGSFCVQDPFWLLDVGGLCGCLFAFTGRWEVGGSGKLEKVSVWMFKLVYTMVEPHPLEEGWARWARWRRVWAFFPCGQTQNWDNSECCFVFCVGKGTAACFLSGYLGIYIIKLSIIVVVRSSLSLVASSFVCVCVLFAFVNRNAFPEKGSSPLVFFFFFSPV